MADPGTVTGRPPFVHRVGPEALRELLDSGTLEERLYAHRLILVRGSEPSDHLLAEVALSLGTPQVANPERARVPELPFIKHQVAGKDGNYDAAYWHQDRNFGTTPVKATVLQCHVAPTAGGRTPLLDGVATLAALDEDTRAVLRTWRGTYEFARVTQAAQEQQFSDIGELARLEDFEESVVLTHPVTGRESIALSERYVRFIDDTNTLEPGLPRVQTLRRIIEDGEIYRHEWQDGDLLIWDDYATLHRGDPVPGGSTKITHRIVVI